MKGALALGLVWTIGCGSPVPRAADAGTDTLADAGDDTDTWPEYEATGLDILLVVDNSGDMREEQEHLATYMYRLVGELTGLLPAQALPELSDDIRVAVVSGDMGLQWGGNPYQNGDGWPGDLPTSCGAIGDDGEFRNYGTGKTIWLLDGLIPCTEAEAHCPAGWTCETASDDGGSACFAADEYGTVECPPPPIVPSLEIAPAAEQPSPEALAQVACLTSLGTNGCLFWQQQLQAQAVALDRPAQLELVREDALLMVVVVTTTDDWSIESNELFLVPEIQELAGELWLATGLHPEYLYGVEHYRQKLLELKGGNPKGLVFTVIAGVPMDPECEGWAAETAGCLDHPVMQLEVAPWSEDTWDWAPACERWIQDVRVTYARPARRLVELAQALGPNSYVLSICNDDWTAHIEALAARIAEDLGD